MKRMRRCPAILVALLLLPFLAAAAPAGEPPLTGRDIFLKHYEALGGLEKLKAEKTAYTEGETEYDGLKGTFRQWEKQPIQYRLEEDYSVIRQTFGDNGRFSWMVDTNGKIQIQRDDETLKRRRIKILLENFDHIAPDTRNFTLTYEGKRVVEGVDCLVVKVVNSINDDISWNYFNAKNFLLVKTVLKQPDIELHTRYSDIRTINGVKHPFREETDIHPRDKKEIIQLNQYLVNIDVAPSRFEPPEKDAMDFRFLERDKAENIPFQMVENNLYLGVTLECETRLWLLDSGASMSVVDADYAATLGLADEGSIKGFGFGENFELSFATLPAYRIPGIQFNPQKVYMFKGLSDRFEIPGVVGILGYDFLSRFFVRIDYAGRVISFYHPDKFTYTGPGPVMDAPLKNRTFTVPMTVDGKYAGKWSLDLGAFNISFHYPFAEKNQFFSRPGVDRVSAGMGGHHRERILQFDHLTFGGYTIPHPLISFPLTKQGSSSGGELTGNIGNALFRHFVLYLDYKHQQVMVEKGGDFNRRFPRDNSGLLIGQGENGLPEIVFVAPGTPGETAGFHGGDFIQAVNGISMAYFPRILTIRELLRETPGTTYTVTVLRNGNTETLRLTLKDLFDAPN